MEEALPKSLGDLQQAAEVIREEGAARRGNPLAGVLSPEYRARMPEELGECMRSMAKEVVQAGRQAASYRPTGPTASVGQHMCECYEKTWKDVHHGVVLLLTEARRRGLRDALHRNAR